MVSHLYDAYSSLFGGSHPPIPARVHHYETSGSDDDFNPVAAILGLLFIGAVVLAIVYRRQIGNFFRNLGNQQPPPGYPPHLQPPNQQMRSLQEHPNQQYGPPNGYPQHLQPPDQQFGPPNGYPQPGGYPAPPTGGYPPPAGYPNPGGYPAPPAQSGPYPQAGPQPQAYPPAGGVPQPGGYPAPGPASQSGGYPGPATRGYPHTGGYPAAPPVNDQHPH